MVLIQPVMALRGAAVAVQRRDQDRTLAGTPPICVAIPALIEIYATTLPLVDGILAHPLHPSLDRLRSVFEGLLATAHPANIEALVAGGWGTKFAESILAEYDAFRSAKQKGILEAVAPQSTHAHCPFLFSPGGLCTHASNRFETGSLDR